MRILAALLVPCTLLAVSVRAQVYSPVVVRAGAVDTSDMHRMAAGIVRNAHAETPREKAEAIWRYFLTDGRFVRPGIFYHIPGWAYEEPMGEVLDPVKLVNSYGFGLCYQDAPLLQATWEAAGMPARVWFLTGHTVAEVFYEGAYHYYDSDEMGYTTTGNGPVWSSPVASVQQLANDPKIILNKLKTPTMTLAGAVDAPWYPADLRAAAIPGIAELFASRDDNYVFTGARFSAGHTMDFTLRPGERMIRNYASAEDAARYLPYKKVDGQWEEFPRDWSDILQVKNGPLSEKDSRRWSTGVLEYEPPVAAQRAARLSGERSTFIYQVASPYVLIDARFGAGAKVLNAETSVDDGRTWTPVVTTTGTGWAASAGDIIATSHGQHNAVAGTYGYLLRVRTDTAAPDGSIPGLVIRSVFELNPRTLPDLQPGKNHMDVTTAEFQRRELPVQARSALRSALSAKNVEFHEEGGQGYLRNEDGQVGELIFALDSRGKGDLNAVDAGGRFLDLSQGLAPDKLTAETRKVKPWPTGTSQPRTATVAWSTAPTGPWTEVWSFDSRTEWPDGAVTPLKLQWPQVDRTISGISNGAAAIYVRYRLQNLALDDIRLATMTLPRTRAQALQVTHCWTENGNSMQQTNMLAGFPASYDVQTSATALIRPVSIVLSAAGQQGHTADPCGGLQ
ncbi:MAG: hypothetical protein ACRYF4_00440 [Janthinobacterium lividum]